MRGRTSRARRRPPPLAGAHERCDAECPKCRTHAAEDPDEATPRITGFTAESMDRLSDAVQAGAVRPMDIEANFYCPRCEVVWSGIVTVEPGGEIEG